MAVISQTKSPSDEHHWTLVMISQQWFRYWLGAVRQQAITWTNLDLNPCCHRTSLSHNALIQVITCLLFGIECPSHYPNQYGLYVNWTFKNTVYRNLNQNTKPFLWKWNTLYKMPPFWSGLNVNRHASRVKILLSHPLHDGQLAKGILKIQVDNIYSYLFCPQDWCSCGILYWKHE